LRAFSAEFPLERDEGEYAYIGGRLLLGEIPYRDAFDQKPPGVFAVYAVIIALFGASPAAIHWATQAYTLVTLGAIFAAGRRLFGPAAGVSAAVLAAYMTADCGVLGNAANTEIFMILPLTAGLVAVDRASVGWAAAAGGLAAAAILFKQVALPNVLPHGAILVFATRRRVALATAFTAAVAVVLGSVVAAFAVVGALPDFWECVVSYNLTYAGRVPFAMYPVLFLTSALYLVWAWGPILALATVGLAVRTDAGQPATIRYSRGVAAAWLAASAVGVGIGGYFREHYFIQAIPPLADLAGRGAGVVGGRVFPAASENVTTHFTAAP
jgi:hypothetical protein